MSGNSSALVTGWSVSLSGLPGPLLRQCLEAAVAAPSIHNSQPWRFRLHDRGVDVLADRARRLDVIDPGGRELLISVGAAIFNLRTAIAARGRLPVLALHPAGPNDDCVARVTIGPQVTVTPTMRMLDEAIPRRRTNRRPFLDTPVPSHDLDELAEAVRAEGASLEVVDEAGGHAVLSLVRTAEARWRRSPRYWLELAEWTRRRTGRADGIPPEAFGPGSAAEALPLRDFGLVESAQGQAVPLAGSRQGQPASLASSRQGRVAVPFELAPTIAVLRTPDDGPPAWLRGGQALQRLLLTATARGLSATPMTQPLELPSLRALLDGPAHEVAQAIVRIGYGPPCPPTPRRPLDEVLVLR